LPSRRKRRPRWQAGTGKSFPHVRILGAIRVRLKAGLVDAGISGALSPALVHLLLRVLGLRNA